MASLAMYERASGGGVMAEDWLKTRILQVGKKPIELARHLNIEPTRVYEMLRGKRRFQPVEIPAAASFLQMSVEELISRTGGAISAASQPAVGTRSFPGGAIPVLRVLKQTSGEWMLTNEKAGEVSRPDFMSYASKAFSITVMDDANAPVYRVKDRVLIDPETPLSAGDDCLLTVGFAGGPGPALLGRLEKEDEKSWTVRQYGIDKSVRHSKEKFTFAYAVTGRYISR